MKLHGNVLEREVFEESYMRITPLVPSMTFQCPKTTLDTEIILEPIQNYRAPEEQPCPLIIGRHDTIQSVTAMFLATSDDDPIPSMETKALMLLTRNDVLRLCSETITLEEYQSSGGQVLFGQQVNPKLPLKPFGQLVMLSMILERYPNVIPPSMFPKRLCSWTNGGNTAISTLLSNCINIKCRVVLQHYMLGYSEVLPHDLLSPIALLRTFCTCS